MVSMNVNLHSHSVRVNLFVVTTKPKAIAMEREDVERLIKGTFAVSARDSGTEELSLMVAPKQARSRDTLARLLNAAEQLLEEGGLDAATVPAIAERAAVSVGVVYRRFPDKDALLRAVYERFFWRVKEQNNIGLATFATIKLPLPDLIRGMVRGMVEGYRRKRNILRALLQYSRTHPDAKFKRTARELNRASTGAIMALLLSHRERIKHPEPEKAIEFVVLTIASVLHTVILEDDPTHGLRAPEKLEEELVLLVFGYLGVRS